MEENQRNPRLKPYVAFATGAGLDEDGYYLVIVLLNEDEAVAEQNKTLLEQRIDQSNISTIIFSFPDGTKWSVPIESMEIESRGRLTLCKLYGAIVELWDSFEMYNTWGPYEPLLLHE